MPPSPKRMHRTLTSPWRSTDSRLLMFRMEAKLPGDARVVSSEARISRVVDSAKSLGRLVMKKFEKAHMKKGAFQSLKTEICFSMAKGLEAGRSLELTRMTTLRCQDQDIFIGNYQTTTDESLERAKLEDLLKQKHSLVCKLEAKNFRRVTAVAIPFWISDRGSLERIEENVATSADISPLAATFDIWFDSARTGDCIPNSNHYSNLAATIQMV